MEQVKVKLLNENAVMPTYGSEGAAGFDLYATEDVLIEPESTKKISLGLAFELPVGYELQIRPRSGITLKTNLRVQLGTVDSDYRAEVSAIVDNNFNSEIPDLVYFAKLIDGSRQRLDGRVQHGTYIVKKGDRIAQGVIQKLPAISLVEANELSETERGSGGFGSTGVNGSMK